MSDTPAISLPDGAAAEPELLVRDVVASAAWTLVAALRASERLASTPAPLLASAVLSVVR